MFKQSALRGRLKEGMRKVASEPECPKEMRMSGYVRTHKLPVGIPVLSPLPDSALYVRLP